MGCSLSGFSVHGILQPRILGWVATFLPSRDLPDTRFEPRSPMLQADSLLSELPWEPIGSMNISEEVPNIGPALPADLSSLGEGLGS